MPRRKLILCRCEDITVREIEEALEIGLRDIESIKRYTGFGTGFCQGKQCLSLVASILEKRGNTEIVPFTSRPPYQPTPLAAWAALFRDEPKESL
ncbi:MAG: (2Fe-2S)-binding protein [Sandaracinaceae bacterium]|nr:(2Fe-2S)-binding protein [Sandaracinaceae bacterium]MDW8245263.1 (2Fe-2S)-binding protein [Sandaracinaceae bacterium]